MMVVLSCPVDHICIYTILGNGAVHLAHQILPSGISTVLPRVGNKMPRICETDSGMLNSIGLENSGSDVFIRDE